MARIVGVDRCPDHRGYGVVTVLIGVVIIIGVVGGVAAP